MSWGSKWVSRGLMGLTLTVLLAGATPAYATVSSRVAGHSRVDLDPLVTVSSRVAQMSELSHDALVTVSSRVGDGVASPSATHNETEDNTVLTLGRVVRLARLHHPAVVKANEALDAAKRELAARESAFALTASASSTPVSINWRNETVRSGSPSFSLSVSKSSPSGLSTSASMSLRLDMSEPSVQVPSWNVGVSYPLFRSAELNSNNMSVRQAQIALETALNERERAGATAVIDVIQRYYATITSATRLRQAADTLAETQENTESVRNRFALGMASEIDRINAESELRRQELGFIQAQRTYDDRMRSLLTAIGQDDEDKTFPLASWPELVLFDFDLDRDQWMALARPHDVALWQREVAVQTAELQLEAEIEKSRIEASVTADVSRGRQSQDPPTTPDDPATSTSPNWTVQLRLSYPLADGGARQRALEDRKNSLKEAEKALADELLAFEQRMQERFDDLHDAHVNAELAELAYKKAEIEWTGAQAGYDRGFTSRPDLERARRSLEQAYDEWQGAVLDFYVAWWNLQVAVGLNPDISGLVTIDEAW